MKYLKLFFIVCALSTLVASCVYEKFATPLTDFDKANITQGGIMYDKFWAVEAGYDQNATQLTTLNAKPNFFACRSCHGWDLQGQNGAFNSRGATATRPNVSPIDLYKVAQSKTPEELFNAIRRTTNRRAFSYDLTTYNATNNFTVGDQMPDYSTILTDSQVWDIVKFLKKGALDMSQLYDVTYTGTYPKGVAVFSNIGKNGNEAIGIAYYTQACASCHGSDGKLIAVDAAGLGKFMRAKPSESHHRARFGKLGTLMPGHPDMTPTQVRDLYKAMTNITKYPD